MTNTRQTKSRSLAAYRFGMTTPTTEPAPRPRSGQARLGCGLRVASHFRILKLRDGTLITDFLIADPRLEIELSHLQCASSKILIGSKQGGQPRKSEEKEKKRRAGKMSLGLARDATKAQRQDRRSGDPSTRLRAGWRSRERRTCSPQPWRRRATSSRFGPRTGIPASRCRAGTMPGHHSLLTPQSRSFGIGITAFLLYSPVFWDRIEPWA